MADAYTTTLYATSALWIAANNAATATKLVAAGVYREGEKNVYWNIIAA
ncbi:MAG: hypothetical protein WCX63_07175 [Methanoregula sp.]